MTRTSVKRWGDQPDPQVSLLLKTLLAGNLYAPLGQILSAFERLSGHRVEAHLIPVQPCAMALRFCASWVQKDAPLKDVPHYEKINGKDVAVGIVAMSPDGAVLLQLGEAAALLWKDGDQWITITDDAIDGEPVEGSLVH